MFIFIIIFKPFFHRKFRSFFHPLFFIFIFQPSQPVIFILVTCYTLYITSLKNAITPHPIFSICNHQLSQHLHLQLSIIPAGVSIISHLGGHLDSLVSLVIPPHTNHYRWDVLVTCKTTVYSLLTTDYRLQSTDYRLRLHTTDYRLQTTAY